MNNLIKSNFYKLSKNKFFINSLIISFVYIIINCFTIISKNSSMMYGAENLKETFLENSLLIYIFLLLVANTICDDYTSGIIKNIFSKGINKTKYFWSITVTVAVTCIIILLANSTLTSIIYTINYGFGTLNNPVHFLTSIIIRMLMIIAYISPVTAMTIITKNPMTGFIFGVIIPNLPSLLSFAQGFINLNINFQPVNMSYYSSLIFSSDYQITTLLLGTLIILLYIIIPAKIGISTLKKQDIK